jgi:hypothetical protein
MNAHGSLFVNKNMTEKMGTITELIVRHKCKIKVSHKEIYTSKNVKFHLVAQLANQLE